MLSPVVAAAARDRGLRLAEIFEHEPDAGLGNGGLGRLAACFIESMATMAIPAVGYGLRYDYGIFRQEIRDGSQVEQPDHWLSRPDPWEVPRLNETVEVPLGCRFEVRGGEISVQLGQPSSLLGVPCDRPVVGYRGRTINTLRLWQAATPDVFDFGEFSSGDFFGAVSDRILAETVSRVLYPDDSTPRGRSLRFIQEYFLVACSLADIIARFRRRGNDWASLPDKVAIQLNDTHPAMAVAELMRILLDRAKLGWDQAWDITVRTLAYTNHTLLPEALEKWPVEPFEALLPRHLEIIYEINRRFLNLVRADHPGDEARVARMSLIEESPVRQVRMANLAIVGTHSTNGVAAIHSELLRTRTVADFAAMFPERFNNKTNGVTPRRWLLLANPDLAEAAHRRRRRGLGHRPREAEAARPPGGRRRIPRAIPGGEVRGQAAVRRMDQGQGGHRPRSGHDLRYADQADPRVQAATAQRAPDRGVLQPPPCESGAGSAAADLPVRRQGRPGLPAREADHQADQRCRLGGQS